MNNLFQSIAQLEQIYQDYPAFGEAKAHISRILHYYQQTGMAEHLLITGESGTGKSTLTALMLRQYPVISQPESDEHPILVVSIPSAATIGGAAEAILQALGIDRPKGNNTTKTHQAIRLIQNCRVQMILIDEAQHILDKGSDRTQYQVADWLKSLMDAVRIPFVLLGLPRTRTLLAVNEQLRRRFLRLLHLRITDHGTLPLYRVCLELFHGLLRSQGLTSAEQNWDDLGMRLVYASNGRIAYLKRLAIGAVTQAFESQSKQVTQNMLAKVFTDFIWSEGIGPLNPFSSSFCGRELTQAGEPFAIEGISAPVKRRKVA